MAFTASTVPTAHGASRFSVFVPAGPNVSALFITDPDMVERLIAEREQAGANRWDEVWDGVYVMNPLPNNEHQEIVAEMLFVFRSVLGRGVVFPGLNISDRETNWRTNYRGPDIVVRLEGSVARDLGTHLVGGPDFLVEVVSRGDGSRDKLPFYASIAVREVLLVDRDPWGLELYRLDGGELKLVSRILLKQTQLLASDVLGLSFRLVAGEQRPQIEIVHHDGAQRWLV
jgi:Uma2 family endonuclease